MPDQRGRLLSFGIRTESGKTRSPYLKPGIPERIRRPAGTPENDCGATPGRGSRAASGDRAMRPENYSARLHAPFLMVSLVKTFCASPMESKVVKPDMPSYCTL